MGGLFENPNKLVISKIQKEILFSICGKTYTPTRQTTPIQIQKQDQTEIIFGNSQGILKTVTLNFK